MGLKAPNDERWDNPPVCRTRTRPILGPDRVNGRSRPSQRDAALPWRLPVQQVQPEHVATRSINLDVSACWSFIFSSSSVSGTFDRRPWGV